MLKPFQLKQAKSEIKMKVDQPGLDSKPPLLSPRNNLPVKMDLSNIHLHKQIKTNDVADYDSQFQLEDKILVPMFKKGNVDTNKEAAININNLKQMYSQAAQQVYENSEQRHASSICSSQKSFKKNVYSRFNQQMIDLNCTNSNTGRSSIQNSRVQSAVPSRGRTR